MPFTPGSIIVDPVGRTLRVFITRTIDDAAATFYTARHGSTPHSFPSTINTPTEYFAAGLGMFTVTVRTVGGTLVHSEVVRPGSAGAAPAVVTPRLDLGEAFDDLGSVRWSAAIMPSSAMAETLPRSTPMSTLAFLSSGRLSLWAIRLFGGQVVNGITFVTGSTGATAPTNQWFALYDAGLAKLAVTADDTTTAWGANTAKRLALAAAYTVPTSGLYYVGACVVAGPMPQLLGATGVGAVVTSIAPAIGGFSTTGLTDPASAPNPAAAFAAMSGVAYAFVD